MSAEEKISSGGSLWGAWRPYLLLGVGALLLGVGAVCLLRLGGENLYHAIFQGACLAGASWRGFLGLREYRRRIADRKMRRERCCDVPQ